MATDIGRLQQVLLRDLWRNEARDFTAWLAANLDLLTETIGTALTLEQTEAPAGPFSVDIKATDSRGDIVVIENQLEATDHDHLGKLITYLSNLDAKTAVWITSQPRPEHERAVHRLNEMLPADSAVYLIRVEAFRIGDSAAAPKFTIVAGPNPVTRQAGTEKKVLAERHVQRLEFWKGLLERTRARTHLFDKVSPSPDNWLNAGSGRSSMWYSFAIRMTDADVGFYIDSGNFDENRRLFEAFERHKSEIETLFQADLQWDRSERRRQCQIYQVLYNGGLRDQSRWPEVQDALADAMTRLEKAFKPFIDNLKVG